MVSARHSIPLGEGLYTVADVCRILQPTMTRGRVHYWLDTGLLSEPPVAHRGTGTPTLLSFKQLLEVRTAQTMREKLAISLPNVRLAFRHVREVLFAEERRPIRFVYSREGQVLVTIGRQRFEFPTNQRALELEIEEGEWSINEVVVSSRVAWEERSFRIPRRPRLITDAAIMSGSPTVMGTRIETSLLAAFADAQRTYSEGTIELIATTYPRLDREAVREALEFEGLQRAA